jgi:hypothetical protein
MENNMDYQYDPLYAELDKLNDTCVEFFKITMAFLKQRGINHTETERYRGELAEHIAECIQYPVLKALGCTQKDTHEYYVAEQFSYRWTDLMEVVVCA